MGNVMLTLGSFQFGVDTAAYQTLRHSVEFKWSAQPRIGTTDALQFTGMGPEQIELQGRVYPDYKGGPGQITRIQDLGRVGLPLPLIATSGRVFGLYVIEAVSQNDAVFRPGGQARRQDFDVRLRRFDGGLRGFIGNLLPI